MQKDKISIETAVSQYLKMIEHMTEENIFFIQNDYKYRFSTFIEVEKYYKDPNFMNWYMVGLGLSQYLWHIHCSCMRFFSKNILQLRGNYFEIAVGHGEFILNAIKYGKFDTYTGIDISQTAINITKSYIKHTFNEIPKNCQILQGDFFDYKTEEKPDVIVMGEVLEHVENPVAFLKKIYELSSENTRIYISTAINAAQYDHIYQFTTFKEVCDMITSAGFEILDSIAVNTKEVPLEKAEKKHIAIVPAFLLRKR